MMIEEQPAVELLGFECFLNFLKFHRDAQTRTSEFYCVDGSECQSETESCYSVRRLRRELIGNGSG